MPRIIAVANQKGGVAKTTTTVNLASAFARMGFKTLLVDGDPQGNASVSSGVQIRELDYTIYDVLLGERRLRQVVTATDNGYDILPSNADLAGAQVDLLEIPDKDFLLQQALATVGDEYDVVLIDTPPSLNILTVNALTAANGVLVPVQCEYFALEGLSDLIQTLARVRTAMNPDLEIVGVVRTLYDGRNSLTIEVSRQLNKHFGDKVFETIIPRNIRLAEAPSHGLSAIEYDARCSGARAYVALAKELIQRDQATDQQIDESNKQDGKKSKIRAWAGRLVGR